MKFTNIAERLCLDIVTEIMTSIGADGSDHTNNKKAEDSEVAASVPYFPGTIPHHEFGVWVPDSSMGEGWKSCKINASKMMFYSPCGKLLPTKEAARKFKEGAWCPAPSFDYRSFNTVKMHKYKYAKREGYVSAMKPVEVSLVKQRLEQPDDKEKEEVSLSDEDLMPEVAPPPLKKRRLSYGAEAPAAAEDELPAAAEQLLEACHRAWPHPSPDIVTAVLADLGGGLTRHRVEQWYNTKNTLLLRQAFNMA